MTTPAVPDSGHYLQGTLVPSAADTIPAADVKTHAFFNILRDVVGGLHVYPSEGALDSALNAITEFERTLLSGPIHRVVQETDLAPKEDVTKRIPPQVGMNVAPVAGPAIDYNKLAAAIVAMQRAAADSEDQRGITE